MAAELFANNFSTTLTNGVAIGDLTIQVQSAAPAALQGGQFRVLVDNEIMLVTSGQNDGTWTVARAQEGTIAAAHQQGSWVTHPFTAGAVGSVLTTAESYTDTQIAAAVTTAESYTDTQIAAAVSTVPVGGAWDGQEATDAVISGGTLNKVASSIVGSWAVGKTIIVHGAQTGGLGFVSTVLSVSGTTATMAASAALAVSGATIKIGTDDTAAWAAAIAALPSTGQAGKSLAAKSGISIISSFLQLPALGNLRGEGKGATVIACAAAGAGIGYGPQFTHAGAAPDSHGLNGGFLVDGGLVSTMPLFINAKDATFQDVGVVWGNGDNLTCGGQNVELEYVSSGGAAGNCIAIDNGCGDYQFSKVYCSFAGKYHVEIRSSQTAEGVGYGIPQYVYFAEGSFEAPNTFLPGSPGLGCVHQNAGRYCRFTDIKLYMSGFGAGSHQSLVYLDPPTNPDVAYQINGELQLAGCTYTGPGAGYGGGKVYAILVSSLDGSNVAQILSNQVEYAAMLEGETIVSSSSLDVIVGQHSLTPVRLHGQRRWRVL